MGAYKKEITTTTVELRLRNDGLVEMSPNKAFQDAHTIEHARENEEAGLFLLDNMPAPFIIELSGQYIEDDARMYYANAKPVSAAALIVGSFAQTVMGNLFIAITKTSIPMKLFTSKEKAIEWLCQYLPNEKERDVLSV